MPLFFVSVESLHSLVLLPHILPRYCGNPAVCCLPHWLFAGFIPHTFLSGASFTASLHCPGIRLFSSFQTSTHRRNVFLDLACLKLPVHTWWIFELNITQRLKLISPQDREDFPASFLLVVFVGFACCSFHLFYFHWYWRSDDMNP